MADAIYNDFIVGLMLESHDMVNDTFNIVLLSDGYTWSASHTILTDITGNEISGTGYTASGNTLTSSTAFIVTTTAVAGTARWDAADTTWTNAANEITARYAVVLNNAAATRLCVIYDFGSNKSASNADFQIQIDAAGLLEIAD